MIFGVDLSDFQTGVDYAKAVKAGGVRFAILKCGYGRVADQKDAEFETHYKGFRAQGIPVGVYHYSYTKDVAGAKKEAAACLKWLAGRALQLPVYLDMEERSQYRLGRSACMEIARTWIDAIRAGGYRAGIYASTSWWNSVLDAKALGCSVWVADWSTKKPEGCDVWQFGGGSTNLIRAKTVVGISGSVDQDYLINESIIQQDAAANPSAPAPVKPKKEEAKIVEIKLNVLKKSDNYNAQVVTVQRILRMMNYAVGAADGYFGPKTDAAVRAFQQHKGLDVDGIVGEHTWEKLLKG